MKQHPVTPMDEGDLVVHLSRQTSRRLGRVNILELRAGAAVSVARMRCCSMDSIAATSSGRRR